MISANTVDLRCQLFQASMRLFFAAAVLLGSACGGPPSEVLPPDCDFGDVRFSSNYANGRIDACARSTANHYVLSLSPENTPINHSPWYSFTVSADIEMPITVSLRYTEHAHRYHPKLSSDGEVWTALPESDLTLVAEGKEAKLELTVGPDLLWVSGQEIIDSDDYSNWRKTLLGRATLLETVLGKSLEGRDIYKLETAPAAQRKYVVFTGRQHPPEVTGALAMMAFVERVFAEDELAMAFRNEFGILMVPNLNPDGVVHGNWRHNAGGVDLNRDWGPFTQPETRLIRDELARFLLPDAPRLYLFLDFHSTAKDVFYTQPEGTAMFPAEFAGHWMAALQARAEIEFPGYQINWKPGHNPDKPTAKAYMYTTFGIPAITLELGDETDRQFIRRYSAVAAEEMMKLLLVAGTP